MMVRRKVIVIGVDGATFKIIKPLVEKGELPNFKKLMEEGVWGELESTVPPLSGPAWASFQTGKSPAGHGIFDFVNKKPNSYETYYINSTHIKGIRFWDILGSYGLKVGIINVMVTYPPRPVNGFLLTGGLTPRGKPFAYPESLGKEIEERFGTYRLWDVGGISLTEGEEKEFINAYFSNEKRRIEMAKYLMKEKEWDFFMVMLEGADPLQHELWKYIDEGHPLYQPDAPEYIKQAIPNFYKMVDGFLGECIDMLGDEATICVMSDHGFGPLYRYFLVNNFLLEIGMLKLKRSVTTRVKEAILKHGGSLEQMYRIARKIGVNRAISTFRRGGKEKMLNWLTLSYKDIDWSRTKAFAVGTSGHIYLNVKGREPQGIIEPGKEYEETREFIIQNLISLRDPETDEKVIEKVFRREELYRGKFFDHAPDISFLPNKGYGTLHREQFIAPSTFVDSPTSGTHRINGIILFYGPEIRAGKQIEGAKIYDLAPTILHLYGLPIPDDMDGRVLIEIFESHSELARKKVEYQKVRKERYLNIKRKIKQLKSEGKI